MLFNRDARSVSRFQLRHALVASTPFPPTMAAAVDILYNVCRSEPDKGKDRPTKNGHGTGAARFPIIGNEEQLSLVFQALKRVEDAAGSKVKKSFSGSNSNAVRGVDATAPGGTGDWSISAFGGSFGMPKAPLGRGGGQERGGGVEVRAKTLLSRVKRWKEQGLTPEDVRDRVVSLLVCLSVCLFVCLFVVWRHALFGSEDGCSN